MALVATTDDVPGADAVAARLLLTRGVDGLVLATARDGNDLPDRLTQRGVPYVLALRTDGHSPSSVGDDRLGGYLATRHLLDLGHRRIGLIAGPGYASSSRLRREGHCAALREAGVPTDEALMLESSFGIEAGAEAAAHLIEMRPRPTAIFAVNDNTAIGALSALIDKGLRVPEDISLIGYNDIPVVRHLNPPLTTLRVPFDQIAMSAMALLEGTPTDPGEMLYRAAPTLIPRRSTAPRP